MSEVSDAVAVRGADSADPEVVLFHSLAFQEAGDEVTVGRVDTGSFVVLPVEGAELLRRLMAGVPPAAAATWFADTYGEPVDVADFVADLVELDFVRSADVAPVSLQVRWQRLGRVLFSPGSAVLFVLLLAAAAVAVLRAPELTPTYHQLFFTPYVSVLMLVILACQIPLILLHEAAHALAGRRLGLPSRLSVGRRFYFIVFLTSLDGLVAVPRRQRFLPLLAGMLTDLGVLAALILGAAATRAVDGTMSTFGALALGLGYLTLLRLVWQFYFFLRTDIYYLITVVLGCVDLHGTTMQMLRNRFARLVGRPPPHDPRAWHPRDAAVGRWYGLPVVLGYAFLAGTLVWGVLPLAGHVFSLALGRFTGGTHSVGALLDSIVFLVVSVGEVLLALVLHLRSRRRARRPEATVPEN